MGNFSIYRSIIDVTSTSTSFVVALRLQATNKTTTDRSSCTVTSGWRRLRSNLIFCACLPACLCAYYQFHCHCHCHCCCCSLVYAGPFLPPFLPFLLPSLYFYIYSRSTWIICLADDDDDDDDGTRTRTNTTVVHSHRL